MIVKPDTFLLFYKLEKEQNPDSKLYWLAMRRKDIEDVDRLVELSHGNRENIKSAEDWKILEEVLAFFVRRWPEEFAQFKTTIPKIRASRKPGGYSDSKEMMYVASLPPRLERLIKSVFPHQQFNKTFIYKLISKYKIFRIGG